MRKLHFFSTLVALVFATTSLWAKPAAADANGKLPGVFTVGGGKKAYFSQGNLQYQASTGTWRFAEHQWDYVGNQWYGNVSENEVKCDNKLIAEDYSGWIDLFGWGTGQNPTNISTDVADYSSWNDWGANSISNGGGTSQGWRTMTNTEWNMLFGERIAKAVVNGVKGLILLPNDWSTDYYALNRIGDRTADYYSNSINETNWTNNLEAHGAVFLPITCIRMFGTSVYNETQGTYNTPSLNGDGSATSAEISNNTASCSGQTSKTYGRAVRLIQYAPPAEITEAPTANTLYYIGSAQALVTAGSANNGTMNYKLGTSGSWSTSIPTGITKTTYEVYYKAVGDATHSDSEEFGPINVTILNPPATISNVPTAKSPLIYTGGDLELVNAGSGVTGGTLKYSLDGVNWREDIPTASALGDYNVYWKLEGDASHSDYIPEPAYISVSITIPTVSDNEDPSTVLSNLYNNGTSTQLKIERTIYRNGEYNTICLPFALDETQLAASPLTGFNNLKTIKGASISGTAPDLSIDIFVEDVTEMEAGKPYLISYPSANENIVNPVFTGITVTETSPGSVTADGITFRGMFAQVHIDPYTAERDEDYLFLGANSQLMWPNNDGSSMRGFRAYFIIDRTVITPAAAPSGTRARFVNAPKQPTGIENTELNTQAQKLLENGQLIILKNGIKYNAQGQVLK